MDLEVKPLNFNNFQTLDNNKKNQGFSPTLLVFIIILILIIGTLLVIGQTKKTQETKKSSSQEKIVEKKENMATPTEKPKIDKNTLRIKIINGTGTPGEAGKVASLLTDEGFVKENIKTENADEFNQMMTLIKVKEKYQDIAKEIEQIISSSFEKIKIDSSFLDETDDYDIVITTGGKIYFSPTPIQEEKQNPTPTLTSTPTLTNTSTPTP